MIAVMLCGTVTIEWTASHNWLSTLYAVDANVITGLIVFGLTTLARFVVELHQARAELATMAVADERDRIARDLHDLLGSSLSAITLKGELARALVVKHPARADEEMAELANISRQALKDVRRVAHGGLGEHTVASEAHSAVSLLRAAGIDVLLDMDEASADAMVDDVATAVLREAVTNVLRHSRATRCVVTIRVTDSRLSLRLENDGVDTRPGTRPKGEVGGLQNLHQRVTLRDGTFLARAQGSRFQLAASVPRTAHRNAR